MIESDSIIGKFGGSFSFLIGLRNNLVMRDFDIGISALAGKFHAVSGIIISGDTILPINLGSIPSGIGAYVRLNVISKDEGGYTGWVNLSIFLVYSFSL